MNTSQQFYNRVSRAKRFLAIISLMAIAAIVLAACQKAPIPNSLTRVLQNFCGERSTVTSDGQTFHIRPASAEVNGRTYSCDAYKGDAEYPQAAGQPFECQLKNEKGWLLDFVNPGQACAYQEPNAWAATVCWPEEMPILGNNEYASWNHETCQWERHYPAHQNGADIVQ